MKNLKFLAVIFALLVSTSQVSGQLIIRNNGHAEIGINPNSNDLDTVSVLKIFGKLGNQAEGGRISFGDNANVTIGELGTSDTDRLCLYGKNGTYITFGTTPDTIMYYDPQRANAVKFNRDVHTSGVFVQSDERFKENVEPVEGVLSSLQDLEAVTYTLKNDNAKLRAANASIMALTDKAQRDKEFYDQFYADGEQGSERYGFLAQNVKDVFPQLVHTDNSGYMYVDYIGLIPILVESINELRAELAAVKAEKQEDEDAAAPLRQAAQQTGQDELEASLGAAKLYQNAPNPWSSETVIRYSLPQSVGTACIYIYDMQGAQIKSIPAKGRGESQVTLTAHDIRAGMYLYALVADGQLIDSKQMILTK